MNEREYVRERLSAYLDGELSASDRARVERAIDLDKELADQLRQLRATRNMVASLPREKPSDQFVIDVLARAERESLIGSSRRQPAPKTTMVWTRRLAAAAVLVVTAGLGALLTYSFMTGSGRTASVAVQRDAPGETTETETSKKFRGVATDDKNGQIAGLNSKLSDGGDGPESLIGGKHADDLAGVEGGNFFGVDRREKLKDRVGKEGNGDVVQGDHGANSNLDNPKELAYDAANNRWYDDQSGQALAKGEVLQGRRGGNVVEPYTSNLSIATTDLNDALKDIQQVLLANGAVVVHQQQMTNDLGEQQIQLGVVLDADRASIATRQLQQVQARQTVPQSLGIEKALASQRKTVIETQAKQREGKVAEEISPRTVAKGAPRPAPTIAPGREASPGAEPLADEDESRRRDLEQAPAKGGVEGVTGEAGQKRDPAEKNEAGPVSERAERNGSTGSAGDQDDNKDVPVVAGATCQGEPSRPEDAPNAPGGKDGQTGGTAGQGQPGSTGAEAAPGTHTDTEAETDPTKHSRSQSGSVVQAPRVARPTTQSQPSAQEDGYAQRDLTRQQSARQQAVLVVTLTQRDRALAEKLQKLDAVSTRPEEMEAVLDALQEVLLRQQQLNAREAQIDRAAESNQPVGEPANEPASTD